MENVIVTFKNVDADKHIDVTLAFEPETAVIDYKVTMSEGYSPDEPMDFSAILADMFLRALQANTSNQAPTPEAAVETTEAPVEE